MAQKSFTLGDAEYPLGHLSGFRFVVPAKDPLLAPATIQVIFSCHVYSEQWDATVHQISHKFVEDGEERAFCPVRYGCSISLERQIRYHMRGKAFWGRDGNGILNSFFYSEADGIAYPIYFRLAKATQIKGADGLMRVISAYQNPELPARHRFQAINFARLVHQKCRR